jgi:hypothetical protein
MPEATAPAFSNSEWIQGTRQADCGQGGGEHLQAAGGVGDHHVGPGAFHHQPGGQCFAAALAGAVPAFEPAEPGLRFAGRLPADRVGRGRRAAASVRFALQVRKPVPRCLRSSPSSGSSFSDRHRRPRTQVRPGHSTAASRSAKTSSGMSRPPSPSAGFTMRARRAMPRSAANLGADDTAHPGRYRAVDDDQCLQPRRPRAGRLAGKGRNARSLMSGPPPRAVAGCIAGRAGCRPRRSHREDADLGLGSPSTVQQARPRRPVSLARRLSTSSIIGRALSSRRGGWRTSAKKSGATRVPSDFGSSGRACGELERRQPAVDLRLARADRSPPSCGSA